MSEYEKIKMETCIFSKSSALMLAGVSFFPMTWKNKLKKY